MSYVSDVAMLDGVNTCSTFFSVFLCLNIYFLSVVFQLDVLKTCKMAAVEMSGHCRTEPLTILKPSAVQNPVKVFNYYIVCTVTAQLKGCNKHGKPHEI